MSVILDTDQVAPRERTDALQAIFGEHEVPQRASFVAPAERVQHRLEIVSFGVGVQLIRLKGTGLAVERTEHHVRQGAPLQVSVFASLAGGGHVVRNGHQTTFRPGDLGVMDTMRPYSWNPAARFEHAVLVVDDPQTGLPVEKLWQAADQVHRSPLHALLRAHLMSLCTTTPDLAPDARHALGAATHQLLRAALVTAVDGPETEACLDESLFARMAGYAESHLHDPDLTPARIAAEHFVSVRQLYKVWERATGESPHRWIMSRRLERAGTLLAQQHRAMLPIGWVARQSGFTNVSHFSRRFRDAYGMSPRDWSVAHGQG